MTTLGMIGSGLMAREIARLAVAAGINVIMSNSRGPETLSELTGELGPLASAATPTQAATAADTAVIALPLGHLSTIEPALLAGKTVIDITNYYPHRDGRIAPLDSHALTTGQYVQNLLPDSRTVRVFSNISYHHIPQLARPAGAADRSALPIAGEYPDAKNAITDLVDHLGFDTVDAGGYTESWRFEPNTIAYLTPYAPPELERLEDLRSTAGIPVGAATMQGLLNRAERTNQAERAF